MIRTVHFLNERFNDLSFITEKSILIFHLHLIYKMNKIFNKNSLNIFNRSKSYNQVIVEVVEIIRIGYNSHVV